MLKLKLMKMLRNTLKLMKRKRRRRKNKSRRWSTKMTRCL